MVANTIFYDRKLSINRMENNAIYVFQTFFFKDTAENDSNIFLTRSNKKWISAILVKSWKRN